MADKLYHSIGTRTKYKNKYQIYQIMKDEDHTYTYWYAVISDETFYKKMKTFQNQKQYNRWSQQVATNSIIDIRTLSSFSESDMYSKGYFNTNSYVVSVISKAVHNGEIIPL